MTTPVKPADPTNPTDPSTSTGRSGRWHRVDPVDVPDEGRVRSVVVDGNSVALTRCAGVLGALENRCPHQGGPVGEGSIENGWLRCPWHGYDYDPTTGSSLKASTTQSAAYAVDDRDDGLYVSSRIDRTEVRTVSTSWSRPRRPRSRTSSAWSGTPTSGSPTRCAEPRSARPDVHRHPARGRGRLRRERLRQAHRAVPRPARDRRTGLHRTCSTGPTTRSSTAPPRWPSRARSVQRARTGRIEDVDRAAVSSAWPCRRTTVPSGSDDGELARAAVKHATDGRGVAHLVLPDEVQEQPSEEEVAHRPDATPTCASARAGARRRGPRPHRVGRGDPCSSPGMVRVRRSRADRPAERLHAPVLDPLSRPKGSCRTPIRLGAGVLGRSGTRWEAG